MSHESARAGLRRFVAVTGGLAFAASLGYFARQYWVGFDAPAPVGSSPVAAALLDCLLFTIFAIHHSVFARTGLKAWVSRTIPAEMERSAYVWVASALFVVVCAAWAPVPGVMWRLDGWAGMGLRGVQLAAAGFTLVAARHLDVLELAGVRQALKWPLRRRSSLDDHGPYGLVRHPIYLAWLGMVWAAPNMNATRFIFAAVSTVYLLIAIPFEERDLRRTFGAEYQRYAGRVKRRLLPGLY